MPHDIPRFFLTCFCIAWVPWFGQTAEPTTTSELEDAVFWDSVFSHNHVLDIQITLTHEAWDAMQPWRKEDQIGEKGPKVDFGNQFNYVKANVVIDNKPFKDTGLRFKGNSSYRFSSRGMKRPFKIDTNRFIKGQKLHGRTKLTLSNAFLDSAFMKEKLGHELYHAAGLATPGVGWANVTLTVEGVVDKKLLGIYVIIEQVDNRYLESKLGSASKGSLLMKPDSFDDWEYLGNDLQTYAHYNIKAGEKNVDQIQQFAELLKLIKEAPKAEFEREISKRMDLKQFAAYLATTSILVNIDSYIGMPHNYYILMDKADDKLRLLPWDLNETFGTFTAGQDLETLVRWDIDRPWISQRRLVERLFESEGFPKIYRATIEKLMKNDFTKDKLFSRIATFEQIITPYIEDEGLERLRMGINGDRWGINKVVERRIWAIKPFITRRIESVQAQLTGESNGETIENNAWFFGKHDKKNSRGRNRKGDDAGSSKGSVQAEAKGWIDWSENASDEERRATLDSEKFRNLSPEVQKAIKEGIDD